VTEKATGGDELTPQTLQTLSKTRHETPRSLKPHAGGLHRTNSAPPQRFTKLRVKKKLIIWFQQGFHKQFIPAASIFVSIK